MNINILRKQIDEIESRLTEMGRLAFIDPAKFEPRGSEQPPELSGKEQMESLSPAENARIHELWSEVEKMLPPGFSVNGNLLRHLSFNQSGDWADIYARDIPDELTRLQDYRNKFILIEYLEALHPEVARVSGIILSGDLDAALKVVFAAFDVRVRHLLKLRPDESTMPAIGKAFKDGVFNSPVPENTEGVRSFLQGVTGYYRNVISHNTLPQGRNRLEASLSLFALAHEAFLLLDKCIDPSRS